MNRTLRANKQSIRAFLQTDVWTVEKLCALLAHAEDKLSMWSCCCLVGCATADHALKGRTSAAEMTWDHFQKAQGLPLAIRAEGAFYQLAENGNLAFMEPPFADEKRRRLIRPIIRAELRRRQRIREAAARRDREIAILKAAKPGVCNLDLEDLEALTEVLHG